MPAAFQMSFVSAQAHFGEFGDNFWRRRRHYSLGAVRSAAKIFPELAQVSLTLHKMRYMYVQSSLQTTWTTCMESKPTLI